jgi:hypothetical protein
LGIEIAIFAGLGVPAEGKVSLFAQLADDDRAFGISRQNRLY